MERQLLWKENNGETYLYADFRELNHDENLSFVVRLNDVILKQEDGSVRLIIDGRGIGFSFSRFVYFRQMAKLAQKKINKSCFITYRNISPPIIKVYKKFTGSRALFLPSLEEGVNYVTS